MLFYISLYNRVCCSFDTVYHVHFDIVIRSSKYDCNISYITFQFSDMRLETFGFQKAIQMTSNDRGSYLVFFLMNRFSSFEVHLSVVVPLKKVLF